MSEEVGQAVAPHLHDDDGPKELVLEGRNKFTIHCQFCPSVILCPDTAVFFKEEKALPKMSQKKDRADLECDTVVEWFVLEDIMQFENIGVTNTVEEKKYLICADCEMGPVGWTDLSTKKCFIALSRVRHSPSSTPTT